MKTGRIILATLIMLFVATPAFAATLSHSPNNVSLKIPAGSEAVVQMTVTITDAMGGTYFLWFVDSVEGDLPMNWISPAKATTFLNIYWNSASTILRIAVPKDTEPGTYSSYVRSKAMKSHEYAAPGMGMLIEVVVPSNCASSPVVDITSLSPDVIWPPNHSMEVVNVSGTIRMPAGCTLYKAGYSITDEYGVYTGEGEFTVNGNGDFKVSLPVEAWRDGQDMDGRHYTIKLFAENDAGTGTSNILEAVVPHDKGLRPNSK